LSALLASGGSFQTFALKQSQAHADFYSTRAPSEDDMTRFTTLRQTSVTEQDHLEATQTGSFEHFFEAYQRISV